MTQNKHKHLIEGNTGLWEVVIGLEVHAQVSSESKLFSASATAFGAEPNAQVSLVDAAMPGMLPVINKFCVEQAVRTGIGLNAAINLMSIFDRKNYFYADLPQGYQISQFSHPIVGEGYLDIDVSETESKRIRIERLHLEQDAGKSIHDMHPTKSFIDLNRSGIALMEIVTKPDMRTPEEAMAFVKKLRALLRALGTCDGNMEQGSMRADVNVSLHRPNEPFGTRAEIKNINSVRFVGQAIRAEIARQLEILEGGGHVVQETRLYDPTRSETRSMRSKEDAHDYRYFPDPDLPPLRITEAFVARIRETLPELPDQKKQRFMDVYGLPAYDAGLITGDEEYVRYFETGVRVLTENTSADTLAKQAKMLANWMLVELFGALNRESLEIQQSKVTPEHLAELVQLIASNEISGKIAKDVFAEMFNTGHMPKHIVAEKGLTQVSDEGPIVAAIQHVFAAHPDKVQDYKSGQDKLFGWFVGQVMKATQGKGNPQMINDLLRTFLSQ